MKAATRIRLALRAALRRRYGYAALRVLRRALGRALEQHDRLTVGPARYDGQAEFQALYDSYRRALERIRRRWPQLDLGDERALP